MRPLKNLKINGTENGSNGAEEQPLYVLSFDNVRLDSDLSPGARLLFEQVYALSRMKGYCWATNRYLADVFNVSQSTIRKQLDELERGNYIYRTQIEGKERHIHINESMLKNRQTPCQKITTPPAEKITDTLPKIYHQDEYYDINTNEKIKSSGNLTEENNSIFSIDNVLRFIGQEIITSDKKEFVIGDKTLPMDGVKLVFSNLTISDITSVIDKAKKRKTKISNPKQYIISSLYNLSTENSNRNNFQKDSKDNNNHYRKNSFRNFSERDYTEEDFDDFMRLSL
ncbi:MAG: helix-turn-helix domain-containing protein [Clostridiales bacterium]|nr:helix-turn-helix domain-containing protein [Clostridiales bacterium]